MPSLNFVITTKFVCTIVTISIYFNNRTSKRTCIAENCSPLVGETIHRLPVCNYSSAVKRSPYCAARKEVTLHRAASIYIIALNRARTLPSDIRGKNLATLFICLQLRVHNLPRREYIKKRVCSHPPATLRPSPLCYGKSASVNAPIFLPRAPA